MRASRKGCSARKRAIGAAVVVLVMLCWTAGSAQAISWIWTLDQNGNGSMGSEAEAANPSTPADYPPTFTNPTPTQLVLTVVGPVVDGAEITLGGFFLPPGLCFGDSLMPTCPSFSVPGTLVGEIMETSLGSGSFDVTFDEIEISHFGTRDGGVTAVSGTFPLILSTLPTTVRDDSLGPTLFDGDPISYNDVARYTVAGDATIGPFACTDGPTPTGLPSPLVPLLNGTDFSNGSRLTMGGATCGTGLNQAYLNAAEQPFLLGLTGTLVVVPEPGTLLLVTSGLLGLVSCGQRRRLR